ncbi:MAG: hypothetical protein MJK12_02595 [Colwellia sp.]|nr:hypothetical protein [Colwellia sp.]
MEFPIELMVAFVPWITFLVFSVLITMLGKVLLSWAKYRRAGAIIFGVLVQMLTPDPYVQRTIETMVIEKKVVKKHQEESSEPSRENV